MFATFVEGKNDLYHKTHHSSDKFFLLSDL